jgi:hypothetical protein
MRLKKKVMAYTTVPSQHKTNETGWDTKHKEQYNLHQNLLYLNQSLYIVHIFITENNFIMLD